MKRRVKLFKNAWKDAPFESKFLSLSLILFIHKIFFFGVCVLHSSSKCWRKAERKRRDFFSYTVYQYRATPSTELRIWAYWLVLSVYFPPLSLSLLQSLRIYIYIYPLYITYIYSFPLFLWFFASVSLQWPPSRREIALQVDVHIVSIRWKYNHLRYQRWSLYGSPYRQKFVYSIIGHPMDLQYISY